MSTLREQLAEMLANAKDNDEVRAMRVRSIEQVRRSGIAPGLKIGDQMPEFTLPDAFGNQVSSRELLAQGPLVISFYRGEWCPYCNLELRALNQAAAEIRDLGGSIVAVSGEPADRALAATEKHTLSFPVLSDIDQTLIRACKLRYEIPDEIRARYDASEFDLGLKNADGSWTLPVPATFVVDRSGTIVLAYVDADYRTRLDPTDIVETLAKLDR